MKRFLLIILLLDFLSVNLYSQKVLRTSEALQPLWVNSLNGLYQDSSYDFLIVMDTGGSLATIKNNKEIALSNYLESKMSINGAICNSIEGQSGTNGAKETEAYKIEFTTNKEVEPFYCKTIDNYWLLEDVGLGYSQYRQYTLYAVSQGSLDPRFDNISTSTHYGFEAGWRSAVVPGWGQFHKGDYKKGAMMLGGTLALAGSVVLTEATRADYEQKYGLTHDVSARKEYLNRHNHWQLARNICVGALAGFYIYNIVDAFNAPGARYVVVRLADNDGRTYNFAPSVSPEGYPMAMATITF